MSKINDILKEFSTKGILTEESVKSIVDEFESAVEARVEQKLTEEGKGEPVPGAEVFVEQESDDRIEESNVVEVTPELIKRLDEILEIEDPEEKNKAILELKDFAKIDTTVEEQVQARMKVIEEQVQLYKEKLEQETKETVRAYIEEFVIPNADRMIIEESIKEQSAHLVEESIIKDEAIETLTGLTNKLSIMIKKDPIRNKIVDEAKKSKLLEESNKVKAKSREIKRNYIRKQLKKRVK